ncbi:MAG: fumarylacetoacetase [Flavobacteriales bacterium]|nr:fumarylacetoacetase [Flavobacteriales bacterium]MCB9447687.1 fumarylacetoacetase [Flavobacteriales bacterium]
MNPTNSPKLTTWLTVPEQSDFPIQNIPFGIFRSNASTPPRVGSRIGDTVIDIHALSTLGYLGNCPVPTEALAQDKLNAFFAMGRPAITALRNKISEIFRSDNAVLRDHEDHRLLICQQVNEVTMLMPVFIQDYTDFYSSMEHATNAGKMFRDPANALLPNWKHLPVGYHGRSSSIILSGTDIHRPKGQTKADDQDMPSFGPCKLLDFELEMAFITCKENKLGSSVSTSEAPDYIAGFVLFNDWSARDIQKWEYVPLGPFLSKNFASSISAWVVTLDALEPFQVASPKQDPPVLPYLQYKGDWNYNINLEVWIQPEKGESTRVTLSNFKYMYWNICQQLAHHTVNGCNIQVGDLYGSGTISGPDDTSYGSMLEITWRGSKPVKLKDGSERKFIQDSDTVILKGYAEKDGVRIGFGEVSTKVLPAI